MYGATLKTLRITHGYTLEEVAERIGISISQVQRFEAEAREPRFHELTRLANLYRVPVAALFGEGDLPNISDVPRLSWVSAGTLQSGETVDNIGKCSIIKVAGLTPGDWIALEVQGDSMDRISPPGSLILVNRKDKALVANACYVIADDDGNATYKRYRPNPDRFEPVSVNPRHEPIYPHNDPVIIGRVRRTILEM